jgi:hypothetical protein
MLYNRNLLLLYCSLRGHREFLTAIGFREDATAANWKWTPCPSMDSSSATTTASDVTVALEVLAAARDAFQDSLLALRSGVQAPSIAAAPSPPLRPDPKSAEQVPVVSLMEPMDGSGIAEAVLPAAEGLLVSSIAMLNVSKGAAAADSVALSVASAARASSVSTSPDAAAVSATASSDACSDSHLSATAAPIGLAVPPTISGDSEPRTLGLRDTGLASLEPVGGQNTSSLRTPLMSVAQPAFTVSSAQLWTVSCPPADAAVGAATDLSYAEVVRLVSAGRTDELPGVRAVDESLSTQASVLLTQLYGGTAVAPTKPWAASGGALTVADSQGASLTGVFDPGAHSNSALLTSTPQGPRRVTTETVLSCASKAPRKSWSAAAATPTRARAPLWQAPPSSRSPWLPSPSRPARGDLRSARAASAPAACNSATRASDFRCSNPSCPRHSHTPQQLERLDLTGGSMRSAVRRTFSLVQSARCETQPSQNAAAASSSPRLLSRQPTALASAVATAALLSPLSAGDADPGITRSGNSPGLVARIAPPLLGFKTPSAPAHGRDPSSLSTATAAARAAKSAAAAALPTVPFDRLRGAAVTDDTLDSHGSPIVKLNRKGRILGATAKCAGAPSTAAIVAVSDSSAVAAVRPVACATSGGLPHGGAAAAATAIMVAGSPVPRTRTFREALLAVAHEAAMPELLLELGGNALEKPVNS